MSADPAGGTAPEVIESDLRYGIIGAGMMGVEHIVNLNALDGARVVAAADPHEPSRVAATEAADNSIDLYERYQDLLDAGNCDALVVATPNHTHVDVLADVLTTELPVLIEKPMCTTVEDCRKVVSMAADRSAPVWVGLEYRYMAPVARLIQQVRSGVVGPVRMVAIREHRFPFLQKVDDWNRLSRQTGGTLVEKCCHFFDLMNLLVGERPRRVFASGGQDVNHLDEVYGGERSDILDNAFVIVDYEGGARASLDLCMFAEATRNQEEVSVVGDAGKIEALLPQNEVRVGRRGEHTIGSVDVESVRPGDLDHVGHIGQHHGSSFVEHQRFLAAIRAGVPPEVTVHDGLISVALGVAAHRSIETGGPVDMSDVL